MPNILLYLNVSDKSKIIEYLNSVDDIAFIISDGKNKWKAVDKVKEIPERKFMIWHKPSDSYNTYSNPDKRDWGFSQEHFDNLTDSIGNFTFPKIKDKIDVLSLQIEFDSIKYTYGINGPKDKKYFFKVDVNKELKIISISNKEQNVYSTIRYTH